jgi:alpha-1,2-mannosyltransferase
VESVSLAPGSSISARSRAAAALPWLLGAAFIFCFAARDLLLTHGLIIDRLDVWGRDFINVWTGGHLVRQSQFSTLSNVAAYQAYQHQLFGPIGQHNYSYPPVTFPIASLLSQLPYPIALLTWQIVGASFFIWTARPWWPRNVGPVWLAALTPAALLNLWAGHYGFFIGGLFLLGWRQVELGRPTLAGICFGLMLIKPHLAILVPLALAMKREWRTIISAAATMLILVAASASAYGTQPWLDFLFGTTRIQAGLIDARGSFFALMSTSPATAALSVGASRPVALIIQLAFAGCGIAAVILSGLRGTSLRAHALITSTATFLVLPYAFNYDLAVPMIGALTLMSAAGRSTMTWRLAFYGFIAPQFGMVTAAMGLPLMPLFIAGLLCALVGETVSRPFNSQQA